MKFDDKSVEGRAAEAFAELTGIVSKLRAPNGCPWDREQTHESLKPFIVEESYEVIDAIDEGKPADLKEELGDLLLQIMLQTEISREESEFDIADVVTGLSEKLVNRHPHVFGNTRVDGTDEVLVNWEKIKKKEKVGRGLFDGLPYPDKGSGVARGPNSIVLFQRNLEAFCRDTKEIEREIRTTVIHEAGHYFGMDEDELARRGLD